MALSTSQKMTLFEIIDTPYTGDVDEMYGKFGLSALTYEVGIESKVQLKILDRLTKLTSEEEQKLLTYIDRWEAIGTNPTSVDAGSFGTSSGMTYSTDAELARIQKRVKNIITVRHYYENVQQSAAESGSAGMSISTIR